MGNLQSEVKSNKAGKQGKVKQLMKIRGRKGNKSEDVSFAGVVPEDAEAEDEAEEEEPTPKPLLVTDSWCKVNQETQSSTVVLSPGAESSPDSVFVDPLTPMGFSAELNQCYQSEEEEENFSAALNSFKLNHHYNRSKQDEISQKLSKLGFCKTSQISLDAQGQESFETGNVEVVRKEESFDDVLNFIYDEVPLQIRKRFSDDITSSGKLEVCILEMNVYAKLR